MIITTNQYLMILALLVLVFVVRGFLLRRQKDDDSALDLEDLLIGEDGRLSKAAAVMMGAFLTTTWMMVYLTVMAKMTEGYLAIYVGAWIGPTVTRLITDAGVKRAQVHADNPDQPGPVQTTTTTTTSEPS